MGVIGLVGECAGAGRVLQVRVSDNEGVPPVRVVSGRAFHVEVDYLPVTLHDPMRMTVTVVSERGEMTVVRAEVGRVLLPGVASMAIHAVVVSANFEGQEVVLRVELGSGDLIEACIELPTCVTAPAA